MGDGRIFLKTCYDASFNKDLSNEPNFDQIHLAGQYLQFSLWKSQHKCRLQTLFRLWQRRMHFGSPKSKLVSKLTIKKQRDTLTL